MNRTRIGLAFLLIGVVAAGFSYARKQSISESHRQARQIILYFTLSRVDNPIIIVGDSIVEASTLPRELCGHAIVNAGLNGASTSSDLGNWLIDVAGIANIVFRPGPPAYGADDSGMIVRATVLSVIEYPTRPGGS